ncbi:hypothetical protein D3C83_316990 [compost metagenome]
MVDAPASSSQCTPSSTIWRLGVMVYEIEASTFVDSFVPSTLLLFCPGTRVRKALR